MSSLINQYKVNPFIYYERINFPLFQGERISPIYDIPGELSIWPCVYYITDYGRVFSIMQGYVKEIAQCLNEDGYMQVSLYDKYRIRRTYRINRLVAFFFLPPKYNRNLLEVDHIDCNKLNNHYTNLRWCTHKEQMEFANLNGLYRKSLTNNEVREIIKALATTNISMAELARQYNTTPDVIFHIKKQDTYKIVQSEYRDQLNKIKLTYQPSINDKKFIEAVYDKCLNEPRKSDEQIALEMNTTEGIVRAIRNIKGKVYAQILQGKEPIEKKAQRSKLDEEEALKIYDMVVTQNIPVMEVYHMFNGKYGKFVLNEIKFLRGEYEYLRKKYNLIAPEPKINNATSKEIAREAYKMLEDGFTILEVQEAFKLGESTVLDIKFCRKGFKWMLDEGYRPFSTPIGINKEIAREAYKMLEDGFTILEVQETLNISAPTIMNIKFCRNGFKWMLDEGYKPIEK